MQEELYIGFENYLLNEMTAEEKSVFENKLQKDDNFSEQFQIYKETTQFLELKFSKEAVDFKQNLVKIGSNHFGKTTTRSSKVIPLQSKWFAVAAMLVVFMGVWYFNQSGNPTFSDYNDYNEAHFIERSDTNQNLVDAQTFFNAKNYKKAAQSFAKIEDLTNPELQLYYGISLIETDDYAKASVLLTNISQGNSVYKEDAIWYLALSSLKQKDYKTCKKQLELISQDSEKYNQAQNLLKELD
ncbi:tetratricopeptide repeat protein [Flavobacterium psychraquaticum]|uniref:tetratricopeptide repeat protein n=1 Tax=Flavobacterium psychraquaticum TaxID=3103958 RepID=UPI002ACD389D|nr:tetratricopeptide repeat protein [Flavobacterium sp. LB-N7T]